MKENPYLKAAILEVVDNQLAADDPPETRQTLERLMEEGHSRKQARKLIGHVVLAEVMEMLEQNRFFDHRRFSRALKRLPRLDL